MVVFLVVFVGVFVVVFVVTSVEDFAVPFVTAFVVAFVVAFVGVFIVAVGAGASSVAAFFLRLFACAGAGTGPCDGAGPGAEVRA